jgi:hypothetical protein
MNRAERRDRIRTAYHEAGHAVILYVRGFRPYRATIAPGVGIDGPYKGEVRLKHSELAMLIAPQLANLMLYELAGVTAQRRYSRIRDIEDVPGGSDDFAAFGKHWMELSILVDGQCSDPDEFHVAAELLVRHYWTAIAAFARMLLERETIEHEDLDAALETVTEGCEPFPIKDYVYVGIELGPLPFSRYADLEAAAAQWAQQLGAAMAA